MLFSWCGWLWLGFVAGVSLALLGSEVGRIEAGIRHMVDAGVDDVRHVLGAVLDVLGMLTDEEIIHRAAEEREPTTKLLAPHVGQRHQFGVCGERIARVTTTAKDHRLPEGIHLRQMSLPIRLRDFVKDVAEHLVGADAVVEGVDEQLNLRPTGEIGEIGFVGGF